MNEFKNNTVKEKNLKGNKSTGHSNKTPEMQPERFLAMQINNNAKTYNLITQLNHGCE
ncbi:TPA: hypothetical protein ACR1N3_004817 [Escherichia coli]